MTDSGAGKRARWLDAGIAGCLFLLVLGVYAPAVRYGFVEYDDYLYVAGNQHVLSGLNAGSLRWAFSATEAGYWLPLTWLSLMADRQFFPSPDEIPPAVISARAHHRTNIWLHGIATVLLFALLKRMTGARGPSFLVAFLFGLHPLHVESVVWVTERKDVLSGVFWMLAIYSYARYASRPRAGAYLTTLLLYCLGFLAKPIVVTLPLVLVLLDVWPLRRIAIGPEHAGGRRGRLVRHLFWEKLPFYVLAIAMSIATYALQKHGGAVRTLEEVPARARLANAPVSALDYIAKMVWPARLAVFYPFSDLSAWPVLAAVLALSGITILAVRSRHTRPYLFAGWFWYLITLLPVIGLVQVGLQARADRFTYIPLIGLFFIVAWGGADAWRRWPKARPVLAGLCGAAGVACIALTAKQISYWENSVALFQHTIDVTGPNALAHGFLGNVWRGQLMYDQAAAEYRQGLAIAPRNVGLLVDLGDALMQSGRTGEAIEPLTEAVRIVPGDPVIRNVLGSALTQQDRSSEAIPQLQEAIRLKPDFAGAHVSLGLALQRAGQPDAAIAQFSTALHIQPDHAAARHYLDQALADRAKANSPNRGPH